MTSPVRSPARLAFLDGVRAFAALYVVFHHASQELMYRSSVHPLPSKWVTLLRPMEFGHYAVDIFIVLSGFCLMLPVARSSDKQLPGGFGKYIRRRARRILPPYYAAFALAIAVVCLRILAFGGPHERPISAVMNPRVWSTHLLVLQNIDPPSCGVVDPPFWSVATEWHIYFLFPLLLLPVWRRWGSLAAITTGVAVGLGIAALFPTPSSLACPWFVGLFAMGMAGAWLTAVWERSDDSRSRNLPWFALTGVLTTLFLLVGVASPGWFQKHRWVADVVIGVATFCFLQAIVAAKSANKRTLVGGWLESRYAVAAGAFSYSIYLIHYPFLQLAHTALVRADASAATRTLSMLVVVPLLIVVLAYLFHVVFERPFMPGHGRSR